MYDLIIIGSGSAGLPAGMYASRYKLKNLVIGSQPGGALGTSHCVENYPGTISASGKLIMEGFAEHARVSGSEIIQDEVRGITGQKGDFTVQVASGKEFQTKAILLATGNQYRKLGVPGEEKFLGAGVSYCATCDGMFFRNREVAVVGGGDAAFSEALYLAELCAHVHVLVRGDRARAENIWVEKVEEKANMTIHYNTQVTEIAGNFFVESLVLQDGSSLKADGIFIAVGNQPDTSLVDHFGVALDDQGYVRVDAKQATSVPGIYAAGDITTNSDKFKQTIMSAAEGCLAAHSIHEELLRG